MDVSSANYVKLLIGISICAEYHKRIWEWESESTISIQCCSGFRCF